MLVISLGQVNIPADVCRSPFLPGEARRTAAAASLRGAVIEYKEAAPGGAGTGRRDVAMIKKKTARELLAESFREIAGHKRADKITVREIAENCGYSPATFYRMFRDKYDLMAWDYVQDLERVMGEVYTGSQPWPVALLEGAHYYKDHQDYLVNLLRHTSGREAFENCLIEANYASLKQCITQHAGGTEPDHETALHVRLYCAGTVRLACEWLCGCFTSAPEEMAVVWERALPAPLAPYLYESETL